MNNRIRWIDAAKGIGIFLVVLGHMLPPGRLTTLIWTFHMPLFFFLSGMTARPSSEKTLMPSLRGLRSIVTPYLVFRIFSILVWTTANQSLSFVGLWTGALREMIYGVAGPDGLMKFNVPLWFFTCLLSVKLLFMILTLAIRSKIGQVLAVLMMAFLAHAYIYLNFASVVWNLDVALSAMVFYVAGFSLKDHLISNEDLPIRTRLICSVVAACGFGLAVYFNGRVDMNGRSFGAPLWFYVGAFCGIFLACQLSKVLQGISALRTMGIASIVIFSLHALFWLLPNSITSTARWYVFKITRSDLLAYSSVTLVEIAICTFIYFAIMRCAPFLLGQFHKKSFSVTPAATQKIAP